VEGVFLGLVLKHAVLVIFMTVLIIQIIIASIGAVKAREDIVQMLVHVLRCAWWKHRARVNPLLGTRGEIIIVLAKILTVARCASGGWGLGSTTKGIIEGRCRRAAVRKVGSIP
jgi:hypothetical protein